MPVLTLAQAVSDGLNEAMKKHDNALIFGEDVGKNGGVYSFSRVRNSPHVSWFGTRRFSTNS